MIMKPLIHVLFSFILLLIFASCEKETVLTVDLKELSFTETGGSQTITLIANKPWVVGASQSWCNVSPSGGDEASRSRITITCDANTTYDFRSCTVTITCAELMETISISQASNNGLMLSQTTYEVTKSAQQLNIPVQANVKFSVEVDNGCKDWVKYNTTKGLIPSTVVLDIAENKTYDSREGKITLKQEGGSLTSTVTIIQSQLDGLFLSTSKYNLSNEKHTLTVEVNTNVEFDVKPEDNWVKYVKTKGLDAKQIVLDVEENDTFDLRETKVNVKQKDGDLSGTITIKQDEKYGLFLSQTEYDLTNEAQSICVNVNANVEYDIVIPDDCKEWIKPTKTKSLNSRNCTFAISKNDTYDAREGSITFKQKNGALSGTVHIKQSQTNGLFVEPKNLKLSCEEQQFVITIKSNNEYEVIVEEGCREWINRISTKGLTEESLIFQVAENEGEDRNGKITINGKDSQETVLIRQQAGIVVFEDALFKEYCVKQFDKNEDGKVSFREVRDVEEIDVYCGNNIKSLKGIEYFINLKSLNCGWNSITELDVSHNTALINLRCEQNKLTHLDVSKNTALQVLDCFSNQLNSLDVSNNLALTRLTCGWNNIANIDISRNTSLIEFGCDANPLRNLDVSHNIALTFLACYRDGLTKLDISHNTELQVLTCFENQLTSLELSHNTKLTHLECNDNKLSSLDVSNNNYLTNLRCDNNPYLTEIWLRKGQTISSFIYDSSVATIRYKYYSNNYGDLAKIITPILGTIAADTITTISVLGRISSEDFKALNKLPKLRFIDLSNASLMNNQVPAQAFINNYELTSIILPKDVETISTQAFMNCISLKMVDLPASLKMIESYAFYGCSEMKGELKLPVSLVRINEAAFASCLGLSGNLIIPHNLEYIGNSAFKGCTGLNGKLVFSTQKKIEVWDQAFSGCSNFTGDLIIPNNVSLGPYCFEDSGISGSLYVHTVGWYSFYDCKIGENLIVCDDVTDLANAFRFVSVKGYTYIGKGAVSLGMQCFSPNDCNVFYVAAVTPPACADDAITLHGKYLGVPKGRVAVYKAAGQWNTAATIEEADFSKLKTEP